MVNSILRKSLLNPAEKSEETRSVKGKKFKSVYDASASKKKPLKEEKKHSFMTPFELMQKFPDLIAVSEGSSIRIPAEIETLFEEMVNAMVSLHENGITETTFYLKTASSVFSGTQVTIREFSTAPKAFNVELAGSPEAVAAFQRHVGELVATFNAEERRSFKINRLETHLISGKKRAFAQKSNSEERGEDDRSSALSLG
jgi:hypothetical protein